MTDTKPPRYRAVVMPTHLVDRLDEIAKHQERSRSWVIRRACEQYVARCDSVTKPKAGST